MFNKSKIAWISLLAIMVVVSGCGQKKAEMPGQSFGSIVSPVETAATPAPTGSSSPVSSKETPSAVSSSKPVVQGVTASPSITSTVTPMPSPQADADKSTSVPAVASPKPVVDASPAAQVKPESRQAEPAAVVAAKPKPTLSNEITWNEFFDTEKQDTPSNKFWDMNGKTVQIKGFMGEVLSFDKHWFLLIPKPGAECPFDNGDETYWNKIMIVYVPDSIKLRYTSGPLLITGKLDVGIKLDESGYKTMFRLYDASFERMKE
ncbi:hypothetical protein [Paenibacillus pectinilyticus]|nr:hypothetical protein [Paenibacillus pectinilyticus]